MLKSVKICILKPNCHHKRSERCYSVPQQGLLQVLRCWLVRLLAFPTDSKKLYRTATPGRHKNKQSYYYIIHHYIIISY